VKWSEAANRSAMMEPLAVAAGTALTASLSAQPLRRGELGVDARENAFQGAAETVDGGDDRQGNPCGDQPILDRRCTALSSARNFLKVDNKRASPSYISCCVYVAVVSTDVCTSTS